jgi:hypothetical protein
MSKRKRALVLCLRHSHFLKTDWPQAGPYSKYDLILRMIAGASEGFGKTAS